MILLDPDLDPHRRLSNPTGTLSPESRKAERDARLPSVRTLSRFLKEVQGAVRLNGMVSVLLTTDDKIKTLNRDFRRKNKSTDVLSFPAAEISRGEVAGDLAISVETALRQGREHGHALGVELKVLMVHGLLHLAGYDHEIDDGEMARKERGLRAKLGLPLGLIERTGSASGEVGKGSLPPEKRGQPGARGGAATKKANAGPSTSPVKRRPASLRMTSPKRRTMTAAKSRGQA